MVTCPDHNRPLGMPSRAPGDGLADHCRLALPHYHDPADRDRTGEQHLGQQSTARGAHPMLRRSAGKLSLRRQPDPGERTPWSAGSVGDEGVDASEPRSPTCSYGALRTKSLRATRERSALSSSILVLTKATRRSRARDRRIGYISPNSSGAWRDVRSGREAVVRREAARD